MRRKIGAIGVLHGHLPMNRGEEGEGSIGSLFAHLPMDRSEVRIEGELLVVCLAICP